MMDPKDLAKVLLENLKDADTPEKAHGAIAKSINEYTVAKAQLGLKGLSSDPTPIDGTHCVKCEIDGDELYKGAKEGKWFEAIQNELKKTMRFNINTTGGLGDKSILSYVNTPATDVSGIDNVNDAMLTTAKGIINNILSSARFVLINEDFILGDKTYAGGTVRIV
jgi:hypothetical protein